MQFDHICNFVRLCFSKNKKQTLKSTKTFKNKKKKKKKETLEKY